jgi:hypothetical protein
VTKQSRHATKPGAALHQVSQQTFEMGHSRPIRLSRKATYDRSCLKADISDAGASMSPLKIIWEVPYLRCVTNRFGIPRSRA